MARLIKSMDKVVLNPRHYELIKALMGLGGRARARELARSVGRRQSDIMRDLAELEVKGLIRISRVREYIIKLSDEGMKYLREGLPEEKLLTFLINSGGEAAISSLNKSLNLTSKELRGALGRLRRHGLIEISGGCVRLKGADTTSFTKEVNELKRILASIGGGIRARQLPEWVKELKRREMVEVVEAKEVSIEATKELINAFSKGLVRKAAIVTRLTSELIASGKWREAIIKEFDLSIEVPTKNPKRKHPYVEFLKYVKEVIESMGFIEVKGPHVEVSLWNFDALFVPQYHPSRRESDVYFVKDLPSGRAPKDVLERTREVHEKVWGYRWRPEEALKLILRTHTTPVSLRTIYSRGGGEYRAYSLDRVFRPDTPDPTHLMEFLQLEGIIVGRNVRFKHLLGFFKEFAKRLKLGEILFRPAYFPFTEPSVEGYIKIPGRGWVEVFPGGMFRPEVLHAVGLRGYSVAAWGIGIDRIAMKVLGFNDIRNLYTNNVPLIRSTPYPSIW